MYSVITLSMVKLVPGVILPSKILSRSIGVKLELLPPNVDWAFWVGIVLLRGCIDSALWGR